MLKKEAIEQINFQTKQHYLLNWIYKTFANVFVKRKFYRIWKSEFENRDSYAKSNEYRRISLLNCGFKRMKLNYSYNKVRRKHNTQVKERTFQTWNQLAYVSYQQNAAIEFNDWKTALKALGFWRTYAKKKVEMRNKTKMAEFYYMRNYRAQELLQCFTILKDYCSFRKWKMHRCEFADRLQKIFVIKQAYRKWINRLYECLVKKSKKWQIENRKKQTMEKWKLKLTRRRIEKCAGRFHSSRLLYHCFTVWKNDVEIGRVEKQRNEIVVILSRIAILRRNFNHWQSVTPFYSRYYDDNTEYEY